jgi:predicted DNA-binding protein (UPF0251 family)/predicted Fe-Mo cluster-binding NifX family protein
MPQTVFFKPQGIPLMQLEQRTITIDEFEALRLVDAEGYSQIEAARKMRVSRPTLSRILSEARKGVAIAITKGLAIEIEGGTYRLNDSMCLRGETTVIGDDSMRNMNRGGTGQGQGKGMGRGRGMGQGQGQGQGQKGQCQRQQSQKAYMDNPVATQPQTHRVAVTAEGPTLDDRVDPRFGRAGGFLIVDLETMDTEYMDNGTSQTMAQGAGIQAAENVARASVEAVLTGYVGPKAFTALEAAGVKVGQDVDGMTIREAVEQYKAGLIHVASEANAQQGTNK